MEHRVTEASFYADTTAGKIKLPLDIKVKVFRNMRSIQEDKDELDAFFYLVDSLGDKNTALIIDEMGTVELTTLLNLYFEEFAKYMQSTQDKTAKKS